VITRRTFLKAIRRVLKQFEEYGVTTGDFLGKRGSPHDLKKLVRQTRCHPYAVQLESVLNSYPDVTPTECLHLWSHAILDTVFDQIGPGLAGSEVFPSFFDTHSLFVEVRAGLQGDIETTAVRLADNPHWRPVVRLRKGEARVDPTASQMQVSLLGGPT